MSDVKEPEARPNLPAVRKLPLVEDRDFLPADLEILETPPSPVRLALILVICAFVVTAIVWAYFGRINIVAIANGEVEPTGRVKVIQPFEPGKVSAIRVKNGQSVKAGEVLIELDPADAEAEQQGAKNNFESFRAEVLRRKTAIEAASSRSISAVPAIGWGSQEPAQYKVREERVLAGDLGQLAETIANFNAQIKQKEVERDRGDATMKVQQGLVDVLQQRVDMRATLAKNGAGSKANLIDAEETLKIYQTQLASQMGKRESDAANIDVLKSERQRAYATFIADNAQKLADAQRQEDDWRERQARAQLKIERLKLASSIDGVVYGLTVTTVGQVVGGGDELMRVVPAGAALEIQAYLANQDIGFIKVGDKAAVKVQSFPFTRYGTLPALVERVSGDAIPEPDAQMNVADSSRARRDRSIAGAQPTQNLVYPVELVPERDYMTVEGKKRLLLPGMAVTVEIATGSRRILEYVFSPLAEMWSQSMKER